VIVLAFGGGKIQAAAWGRDAVDMGLAESLMDAILTAIESGCVRLVAKAERPKKRRTPSCGFGKVSGIH
jgi:hypothetical protein